MADDWLFETAQAKLANWMAPFDGMFTAPTWQRVLVLLIGGVLMIRRKFARPTPVPTRTHVPSGSVISTRASSAGDVA